MIGVVLGFGDFDSEASYVRLQNTFLTKDIDYNPERFEELFLPKKRLKINIHRSVLNYLRTGKVETRTIEFEEDFLKYAIPIMADYYFEREMEAAKKANINTPEDLKYWFMPIIEGLNQYLEIYTNANYLNENIKELLINETLKLIDLCETYYTNPYPGVKRKLPLKWTRTEIEYFFHLLKENNQLGEISQADLGRFIDNTIECQEDKSSDIFKPIKDSKNHLSDFKKTSRSEEPSNKALRKLFNDDFFNV